jgi:hypothetical protein
MLDGKIRRVRVARIRNDVVALTNGIFVAGRCEWRRLDTAFNEALAQRGKCCPCVYTGRPRSPHRC